MLWGILGYTENCINFVYVKRTTVDTVDKDSEFDYLRPTGKLILNMDSIYNVRKIDIFLTMVRKQC